jgi:hypothetical protein
MDPEAEENEVEQLLSSEPPKWRPKPPQQSRSRSRQPSDKKPAPTIFTGPPLEPVQELHDTDMEDLVGIPTPNKSQPTATEKRKGVFCQLCSANIFHVPVQTPMR